MEKVKKLSTEQLKAHTKQQSHRTIMWHGIAITVRPLIPLCEVSQFVNSVLDGCYNKEHNSFVPEMMDFAVRVNVVLRYACVELPCDINDQYELLYCSDIYDTIISNINPAQFKSIMDAIHICINNNT